MKLKSWFTYFAMVVVGFAATSLCSDENTPRAFVCHVVGNIACILAGVYLANEVKKQEANSNEDKVC